MSEFESIHNYDPWSEVAEQSVIGGLLINNYKMPEIRELLLVEYFYSPMNQSIFEAMISLDDLKAPVDVLTVNNLLETNQDFAESGGIMYLAELSESTPSSSNVMAYANIVKDKFKERAILIAARDMRQEIISPDGTSQERVNNAMSLFSEMDFDDDIEADKTYGEQMKEFGEDFTAKFEAGTTITGLATGFKDIDEATGGLQDENLIIIAGIPGSGKSTLSMNIATNIAINMSESDGNGSKGHVLVFNMEMSASEVIGRQIAYKGGVAMDAIKSPIKLNESWSGGFEAFKAGQQALKGIPMTIDDRPALSPEQVRAKALRVKRKHGKLRLIIVDYLQLMEVNGSKGNDVSDITKISKSLKRLAKEMKCPVIALSQLNRKVADRPGGRPLMSDLRGSGSIEQDADIIGFVHRIKGTDDEENPFDRFAELIIAKNRSGECSSIKLSTNLSKNTFKDLANAWPEIQQPKKKKKSNYEY